MITGKVKAKALKIGIYLAIGLLIIIIALMSDGRIPGMRGTGSAQSLLDVAFGEYGTVGGDKYRLWYWGVADGAPWCATFIAWCADQIGLIEAEVIPKFESCIWGIEWFKARGLFSYTSHYGGSDDYIPVAGDIIFFSDVRSINVSSHVGIVQYTEGGRVYTIEGNTSNSVLERSYDMRSDYIMGYATPNYPLFVGNGVFIGDTNAEIAWNYFRSLGFNEYATAGILGNLYGESGIDPTKYQQPGPGRGIGQWEVGGRHDILVKFAAERGKPWTDLAVQLEFIWYELNGGDAATVYFLNRDYGGLSNFMNAKSVDWATEAFEYSFERASIIRMNDRKAFAHQFYDQFAGRSTATAAA